MNFALVAVLAWLALGLETGLKGTLAINVSRLAAAPGFVLPLAVFITLCAPPAQAAWVCLTLGLLMDLTAPQTLPGDSLVVIGPYALGFLAACQTVLALRGVVLRRHPLTVVMLSIVAGIVMQIVVTSLLSLRHLTTDPAMVWHPSQELAARLASAVVTGASAFFVALALAPMAPLLGLQVSRGWPRR